jgi:hypothetical protein
MKQVKLFTFSELPEDMAKVIFKQAIACMGNKPLDYGAFKWKIGLLTDDYESSTEDEKRTDYFIEDIEMDKKISEWFYSQGCEKNESVFLTR